MEKMKLTREALGQELWAAATYEAIQDDWLIEDQADFYGHALADAVIDKQMTAKQLRAMVNGLNKLDGQATRAAGGDLESLTGEDYFEAVARRIGHHAARTGLELVGTESDRWRYVHSKELKQQFSYALS